MKKIDKKKAICPHDQSLRLSTTGDLVPAGTSHMLGTNTVVVVVVVGATVVPSFMACVTVVTVTCPCHETHCTDIKRHQSHFI